MQKIANLKKKRDFSWVFTERVTNVLCSLSIATMKVILFTLTFYVKFTLNIKSVVLKICYSVTPINKQVFTHR